MEDLLQQELTNALEKAGVYGELCATQNRRIGVPCFKVELSIEWGDWKHSHIAANCVVEGYAKANGYIFTNNGEEIFEEDGTDCYSALHTYHLTKKTA